MRLGSHCEKQITMCIIDLSALFDYSCLEFSKANLSWWLSISIQISLRFRIGNFNHSIEQFLVFAYEQNLLTTFRMDSPLTEIFCTKIKQRGSCLLKTIGYLMFIYLLTSDCPHMFKCHAFIGNTSMFDLDTI